MLLPHLSAVTKSSGSNETVYVVRSLLIVRDVIFRVAVVARHNRVVADIRRPSSEPSRLRASSVRSANCPDQPLTARSGDPARPPPRRGAFRQSLCCRTRRRQRRARRVAGDGFQATESMSLRSGDPSSSRGTARTRGSALLRCQRRASFRGSARPANYLRENLSSVSGRSRMNRLRWYLTGTNSSVLCSTSSRKFASGFSILTFV
jgi:hypothetical protein